MLAHVFEPRTLAAILVGIATVASVITLALPLLATDRLGKRMKVVASERERIRKRERERLNAPKASLRAAPKAYMKRIVDRFSLSRWLGTEQAKAQMASAGFRGAQAETAFLFFRLVAPILAMLVSAFYLFVVTDLDWPGTVKAMVVLACTYGGVKAPEIYVRNTISKRHKSIGRAFPDAMDLLLICIESGMSIEQAFRKVGQEIGLQSVPLAEELTLTTAELSYLSERRTAYQNFAARVAIEAVKQMSTVLIQAERYGTPLGHALRVLGQESRDQRLLAAEQKAAALPPKLTVPMIVFFLPVLFAVIITPAVIQISASMN